MKKIFLLFFCFTFLQAITAQDINIPAQFPGGDSAWNRYLDSNMNSGNINTPTIKKELDRFGLTQRAVYTFGIMTDGSIGLINIEGAVSQAVRNVIQRVLKNSPRWTPASFNGKPVVYRKKQVSTFIFD